MKYFILLLFFVLYNFHSYSQSNGKVIYKKSINLSDSNPNIDDNKLMNSVLQLNYILEFTENSSVFYLEDQLENESDSYAKMAKRIGNTNGEFYKRIEDNFTLHELSMFNRKFMVHLPGTEFSISKEAGEISGYKVYKATAVETVSAPNSSLEDIEKQIVVWFTPEIPVPFGPVRYNGLPGLILKISVGNVSFQVSEITMYDDEVIKIKQPDEGETVLTEKEFHGKLKTIVENL